MRKRLAKSALVSLLTLALASVSGAKERDPITVKDVRFDRTSSGWITADVEFRAGDFTPDGNARKKDYLNRVKLTLTAGYEDRDLANSRSASAEQKKSPFEFYIRSVELAAVRRSKIVTVRFFIPPAVVESKGFGAKPVAWMLAWEVEGLKMPADPERFPDNFSRSLRSVTALNIFNDRLSTGKEANEGVMLAQSQGPASLQPKTSDDFAFVRKGDG